MKKNADAAEVSLRFEPIGSDVKNRNPAIVLNAATGLAIAVMNLLATNRYSIRVTTETPSAESDRYVIFLRVIGEMSEDDVPTPTTKIQESIWSFGEDLDFATRSVALGHVIANRIATDQIPGPAKLIATHASKLVTEIDANNNLVVASDPRSLVKALAQVINAASMVSSAGYKIEMRLCGNNVPLIAIPKNILKPQFIGVETNRVKAQVTGFHRNHRSVELQIGEKSYVLAAPTGSEQLLIVAAEEECCVDAQVSVSQPSNPALPLQRRYQLIHVWDVIDAPGQLKLESLGGERVSARNASQ